MLSDYYDWIKVIHVIFMVSWMAGMLYLPRLFVYHCQVAVGSEQDKLFQTMERRLLRFIMNPAMVVSIVSGLTIAHIYGFTALGIWFHVKMLAVFVLAASHGFFAVCRKKFELGQNQYSERFYRIINEVPAVMMVICVIMVIVKPFD